VGALFDAVARCFCHADSLFITQPFFQDDSGFLKHCAMLTHVLC